MVQAKVPGTQDTHYQVVVVGAGPTGLITANLLGQDGIKTLLVEQHESTVSQPRAVSIDDEALRTVQSIGLIKEVLADVAQDYGSWYFTPTGRCFAKVEPQTREFGYPRRNAFQQPRLEATLLKGLERFEPVTTWFSRTLKSVEQTVDLVKLVVRLPEGGTIVVSCDYLAACDGGQSTLRRLLDIPLEGSTYEQRWLIVDTVNTSNHFRQTQVFCNTSRPAISLPGPYQSRRFEFMLHEHESDDLTNNDVFINELLLRHGEYRLPNIIRRQVYTFQARTAESWRSGRVFLLGDAAHLSPPFAGQGMNSGIRDAQNFSWKAAQVLRTGFPDTLLDTYEIERKPHAKALIELAVLMGRFMMPPGRLRAWFVQWGLILLKLIPPAQRYITQMKFKPKPVLEEGLVVGTSPWVGRLFIQPRLELPDCSITLLDDLIGNRFTCLFFGNPIDKPDRLPQCYLGLNAGINWLWITPSRFMATKDSGIAEARDLDGEIEQAFSDAPGSGILLRPDHYVAAVLRVENIVDTDCFNRLFDKRYYTQLEH